MTICDLHPCGAAPASDIPLPARMKRILLPWTHVTEVWKTRFS